jgi:hypothetical protein
MTPEEAIEKFSKSLDDFKSLSLKEFKEMREYIYELKGKKFCDEHLAMMSRMDTFIAKVGEWMNSTTEYRKTLCQKVDIIKDNMALLPCKERKSWYGAMDKQVRILWGFVGAIVLAIVYEWIKVKR